MGIKFFVDGCIVLFKGGIAGVGFVLNLVEVLFVLDIHSGKLAK